MVVASKLGLIAIGRKQVGKRDSPVCAHLIKIRMLNSSLIGVSVVENPIVVREWQVSIVPILRHEIDTHSSYVIGLIFV